MGFVQEFKEFAVKGNVVDMAVGVIIGGAFGKIVASMVSDILMPPIGVLMGGKSFTTQALTIKEGDGTKIDPATGLDPSATYLKYGAFIDAVIQFLIVAFCLFIVIKAMNKVMKKQAAPAK
jgi:large conductance mechanosensitive channel